MAATAVVIFGQLSKCLGNSTSALSLVNGSYVSVSYYGCQDTDGDGREDSTDAFPADPTQVADSDGDGWGDNQQGNDPDACPFDAGVINGTKPDGTPGIGVQFHRMTQTKTLTVYLMITTTVQILNLAKL